MRYGISGGVSFATVIEKLRVGDEAKLFVPIEQTAVVPRIRDKNLSSMIMRREIGKTGNLQRTMDTMPAE